MENQTNIQQPAQKEKKSRVDLKFIGNLGKANDRLYTISAAALILVLGALMILVSLYVARFYKPSVITPTLSNSARDTEVAKNDNTKTADRWNLVNNLIFGYRVSYPTDWKKTTVKWSDADSVFYDSFVKMQQGCKSECLEMASVSIFVKDSNNKNLDDWLESESVIVKDIKDRGGTINKQILPYKISNLDAAWVEGVPAASSKNADLISASVVMMNKDKIFSFSLNNYSLKKEEFLNFANKILQSFTLTSGV